MNTPSLASYAGAAGDNGCNTGTVCSGPAQAAHDLFMWQADLTNLLPEVTDSSVVVAAGANTTTPSTVSVTVAWTNKSVDQTYVVQDGACRLLDLPCQLRRQNAIGQQ